MQDFKNCDYSDYFYSSEALAEKVISLYFKDKEPSFPIDPFKMLKDFEIVVQPREFKELEGIYIAPEYDGDIALVAINKKQPATRQRYTAAHELCHHIKDRNVKDVYCHIGSGHPRERFANDFASYLLMPMKYLKLQIAKYEKKGLVSLDDIIYIADYFGTSFSSCVYTIAYKLHKLDGETDKESLARRIKKFKPETKRLQLGLPKYDISLLRNMINSYSYIYVSDSLASWYKFKTDFIYNENRMEGVQISEEEVAEVVTDLRINKNQSQFCSNSNQNVIEVLGHNSIYEYIAITKEEISGYSIKELHKMLYEYSPFPEVGGLTRKNNNYVRGASMETVDYALIDREIYYLSKEIENLVKNKDQIEFSEYVDEVVKIHHKLTILHPFSDGNGRISRAMLNWLFRLKELPPVYIKTIAKSEYYSALSYADQGNYEHLFIVFYRAIINSLIQLNKLFTL